MSELYFAEPQWIHLLWAVLAFVALLAWLEHRGGGDLGRFIAAGLQQRLVRRTTPLQRTLRLVFLCLCGVFLTLAMMRPQWGAQFVSTPQVGARIMVALDVSRSMLAEDVAPNRLERAKAELRDLLAYLDGDQVGLIAFAGRATVLSPLTPDFSFLRLVLDGAGPRSVSRGGTRLEEPIRKALAGFDGQGAGGEVSRSILLITDGEDHDSFPLEAAKAAAERGVRIISIGFGDEAGSEILVTDPETGARNLLRDADGTVVQSRLDGEMLREMALLTEGAYIPAGTGVLDLESIYDRHIAGLTRARLDGGGYTVRNEAFQWAVLFALVCLLAAVASPALGSRLAGNGIGNGTNGRAARSGPPVAMLAVGLLLGGLTGVLMPTDVEAETTDASQSVPLKVDPDASLAAEPAAADETGDVGQSASDSQPEAPPEPVDPRESYNQGLADLGAEELDAAEHRFEDARTNAGTDGEVRFRATYNLGSVAVARADAVLDDDPQSALGALYRAADWFREAISLRSEHEASRKNLELVLRRAVVLADHLAKRDEQDLESSLDALIAAQRALLGDLGQGVDLAGLSQDPNAAPAARRTLRPFSTRQLELLSDGERLSETAGQELAALQAKPEEERAAEDAMRMAQLTRLLSHVHRAREHMGQARGQLRRVQAERAYRRVANALTALKRAQDQLLDPVARLDALLADGMELMRQTGRKAALESQLEPRQEHEHEHEQEQEQPEQPEQQEQQDQQPAQPQHRSEQGWLTRGYLGESQAALEERTGELHEGLSAGLTQASEAPPEQQEVNPEQQQVLRRLEAAAPLIGEAREAFQAAGSALEEQPIVDALGSQRDGLAKLMAAREHFLDLKRLVEMLYQDEHQIAGFLTPAEEMSQSEILEYVPVAQELQQRNEERLGRVTEAIIEKQMAAVDADEQAQQAQPAGADPAAGAVSGPGQAAPDPAALQAERQHWEQADALRIEVEKAMQQAISDLGTLAEMPIMAEALPQALQGARASVDRTVTELEALRQLFFSVIDHLRETLRRQLDLGDRTEETSGLAQTEPAEEIARRAGPLGQEQGALAEMSGSIADALGQQAEQTEQTAVPAAEDPQGQQAAQAKEQQERLREAAQHVTDARSAMEEAADGLDEEPAPFEAIRTGQQQAAESLAEALAALQPPQQQEQQDGQDQQQEQQEQQDQQQEQQGGQGETQPEQGEEGAEPQPADPSQLLQGVRDREAQRQEQRAKQQQHRYEPVEKDW